MSIRVGGITTRNRLFLAPMSGVTDEPFRSIAHQHGAGLVVSEMVASEELVRNRPDVVRRAAGARTVSPLVIQLAGRQARWMAEGARVAQDLGADIIDINMGCPARQVTGGLSGSALMRDLVHAVSLIEATVQAVSLPVTLKMRLGWDLDCINAPELARRAQLSGVQMITVHGRTRCQFYKGRADWSAIHAVREATDLPLIANGDCRSLGELKTMLNQSGADGAMIGRGAYGQPWIVGELADALDPGSGRPPLPIAEQLIVARQHYEEMLAFYGMELGRKVARKHLGWYVCQWAENGYLTRGEAEAWRAKLVREPDHTKVLSGLHRLADFVRNERSEAA